MSTRSGARCSMSEVSSVPPWIPIPSSSGGDDAALVGRQAGMGEERHQAVVEAQLAVGDVDQQGRVAAVPVQEHQPAGGRRRDAAPEVVEHGEQRRRRQPDRARRPGVLVRLRVGERRQQPRVELVADPLDGGLGHPFGDQQVGVERQVRAVLLDRAERLHDDAVGCERRGELGCAELAEASSHRHQVATLPVSDNAPHGPDACRRLRRDRRSAPGTTAWSRPPTSPGPGCARSLLEARRAVGGTAASEPFAGATVNICNCDHITFRTTPVMEELDLGVLRPALPRHRAGAAPRRVVRRAPPWPQYHDVERTLDALRAHPSRRGRRVPPLPPRPRCRRRS